LLERLEDRMAPAVFNVPADVSLAGAIYLADTNADTTNIINVEPGTYQLVNQSIVAAPSKTLYIAGQGAGVTITAGQQGRVFTIDAGVVFEDLTITGGRVQTASAQAAAQGGGLLIDGGDVTLSNVNVTGNMVTGGAGPKGADGKTYAGTQYNGAYNQTGGAYAKNGGAGGAADGGGIYLAGGSLTLDQSTVTGNDARGGTGGAGGVGIPGGYNSHIIIGSNRWIHVYDGAAGGIGGTAAGGGIYVAGGQLAIDRGTIDGNMVQGGQGGPGGAGANGSDSAMLPHVPSTRYPYFGTPGLAGPGGNHGDNAGIGGSGGAAQGGGIYLASGAWVLDTGAINDNSTRGGVGGVGGQGGGGGHGGHAGNGGNAGAFTSSHRPVGGIGGGGGSGGLGGGGGAGGQGGPGGRAAGAGFYAAGGTLNLFSLTLNANSAQGGAGGLPGPGGLGGAAGSGGNGGNGGLFPNPGTFTFTNGGHQVGSEGRGGFSGRGGSGGAGGMGGNGGWAQGGGFYVAAGALNLVTPMIQGDAATAGTAIPGGNGVGGGDGAPGGDAGQAYWLEHSNINGIHYTYAYSGFKANYGPGANGSQGNGGAGGNGGNASGGGFYLAGGSVVLYGGTINSCSAIASPGADGGSGVHKSGFGGYIPGGHGGNGGSASGGAVYLTRGANLMIAGTKLTESGARAGNGGVGGPSAHVMGDGGNGGGASGGAIFLSGSTYFSSTFQLVDSSVQGAQLTAGDGREGTTGGSGGGAQGGVLFVSATATASVIGSTLAGGDAVGGDGADGIKYGGSGGGGLGGAVFVDGSSPIGLFATTLSGASQPGDAGGGTFGDGSAGEGDSGPLDGDSTTTSTGPATGLVVSPLPPTLDAATPFPEPLYVLAEDATGKVVPSFNDSLAVAMGSNPDNAALFGPPQETTANGTVQQSAVTGLAIFTALMVSNGGSGDTLQVTSAGISATTNPTSFRGYTVDQIRSAYDINAIPTTTNRYGNAVPQLDGEGQTIAVVDPFDDPNIYSDVNRFDEQMSLTAGGPKLYDPAKPNDGGMYGPAESFLTVVGPFGRPVSRATPSIDYVAPDVNEQNAEEEAASVEWIHAIAPAAKIVLVEFNTSANLSTSNQLFDALLTAATRPGVSVVSLSFGIPEPPSLNAEQAVEDLIFNNHLGVTFLAAAGDKGAAGTPAVGFPAYSPDVIAVGGTTLNNINPLNETGWSLSGGGLSAHEPAPSYQKQAVPGQLHRAIPDVALSADPTKGAQIYSSFNRTPAGTSPVMYGGTSFATPVWAGLIGLVNQGRADAHRPLLNATNPTEALTDLYNLPNADFHDVATGSNGYSAGRDFDFVTGLGTPVAARPSATGKQAGLVQDLIDFGGPVKQDPTFPSGAVGVPYGEPITFAGGVAPLSFVYQVTAGAIPSGIQFNPGTSELDITGTPTAAGSVTVTVTATDATGASVTDSYSFTINPAAPPTVTGVSPATGSVGGGTTVTITGTNLFGATAVDFGSVPGTIVSDAFDQITVTSPPGSFGSVAITATTTQGTSRASPVDRFTYVPPTTPATIVVTTTSDATTHSGISLRDAVTQANADAAKGISDKIGFAPSLAGGIIALAQGQFEMTAGSGRVTIDGGGQIVLNARGIARIFFVDAGAGLVLAGLTLTGGVAANGGAIYSQGALTISNCTLSGNTANNSTFNGGGAVFNFHGTLTVSASTFSGNVANSLEGGGAINNDAGTVTVTNSTLAYNQTAGTLAGGGIYNDHGTLTVSNSTLANNTAGKVGGGGIYSTGALALVNTIVADNTAPTDPDTELGSSGTAAGNNNLIGDGTGLTGITNGALGNQVGTSASPINPMLGPLTINGGTTDTLGLLPGSPAIGAGGAVTTIAQAAGAADTAIQVASAAAIASTPGPYFLLVDGEEMQVTGVNLASNTLTVTRGLNGVSATPNAGDPVSLFADQRGSIRGSPAAIGATEFTVPVSTAPTLTAMTPATGPVGGGVTVTISGTDLANATAVQFGLTPATIVSDSATQIVVTSPAQTTGVTDVTVTTAAGTSLPVSADQFTVVAAPVVTGFSPALGPIAGGTSVAIDGMNLLGATAVYFGQTAATIVRNIGTRIVATSPAGSAGPVDIRVVTPAGTSPTSAADQFAYVDVPTVAAVAPVTGVADAGTSVTITGTNLSGATAVLFGSTKGTIVSDTATQITAMSPNGSAGLVDVTVTTPGGTSATSAADQFTYNNLPSVTAISTASGPATGHTEVTITGKNLSTAYQVLFGAKRGSITTITPTELVVASPPGAQGTVDITVVTNYGTSPTVAADQFTYGAATAPSISGISTAIGPVTGGTVVTITGTNLVGSGPTTVNFGSAQASVVYASLTQVVVDSPASSLGTVDVMAITSAGTSQTSAADQFTYVGAATVTAIGPATGPTTGGTQVTITGTNLAGATAVRFGNKAAVITSDSATQILATAPAGLAGIVDIKVTTPTGGTSAASSADRYTYTTPTKPPAPSVSAVAPASGPTAGNTTVTITGTNLTGATAVFFGLSPGTIVSDTATQIVATSPARSNTAVPTAVDVTVQTPGGSSATSSADQFTYVPPPYLASLSPSTGDVAGGTQVTIAGANLDNATQVLFGGVAGAIVSNSSTQIVAASPPGVAGTVDVTVTTGYGSSTLGLNDEFTYSACAAPAVTGVSPASGRSATTVTITGTNFAGTASNLPRVFFGTTRATVSSFSANQIVATSPSGVSGTADITVTTAAGTSATSAADQFTYVPAPTITKLAPATGPIVGGTQVTITGTNLANAASVYFGSTAVTTFASDTATQIVVMTPPGSPGIVQVQVQTVGGNSLLTGNSQFTYVAAPTVSGITPAIGPAGGGADVLITGTNLANGIVSFGGTPGTVVSGTGSLLIAVAPPGGPGMVDVTVTTAGGTSATSAADQYTYSAVPVITGISPASGSVSGGTAVTISGAGLANALQVLFGTTAVSGFTSDTDGQLVVNSPSGVAGTVDIRVVAAGGTSVPVLDDQFTYGAGAPPTIDNVTPATGQLAGGTTITIDGSNFAGNLGVNIGKAQATIVSRSTTQIVAITPAGSAGTVDVTVAAAGGTSSTSAADQFTYSGTPTVSGISPATGPATGGTAITITGTNLTTATAVNFGSAAAAFIVVGPTQVLAISPPGAGSVDVTITAGGGATPTGSADRFTYLPAPSISTISPATGSTGGGTTVTITGTNLGSATTATAAFGADGLGTIVQDDGTTLVVTSPPGIVGTVDVTVTTAGGTSATSASDQLTYVAPLLPAFTTQPTTVFIAGQANTFTITTTSQFTAALTFSGGDLPATVTFTDNHDGTATLSGTPSAGIGAYTCNIVANNGQAAAVTQVFTLVVVVPPTIASPDHNATPFLAGKAASFTVTTLPGLPTATTFGTSIPLPKGLSLLKSSGGAAKLSGSPAAGTGGTYSFDIIAGNGPLAQTRQSFTLTIDEAPAFTSPKTATSVVGQNTTFTLTAHGFPVPTFGETGTPPSWLTFDPQAGTLSGTPSAGTHGAMLTFTAANGVGARATQTVTVTVAQAPTFSSADHATFAVGKAGSAPVQATGGSPGATTYSYRGTLPTGVHLTGGAAKLSGTPAAGTGGVYHFTIFGSNGAAQTQQAFTLTVTEAPAFASPAAATFVIGQPTTVTVTTHGFPVNQLSATGLPAWLHLHDNGDDTATLGGSAPTASQPANIQLTARNGTLQATQTFAIAFAQPPSFTTGAAATFSVSHSGSASIAAAGGAPGKTTYSILGTPPKGVSLAPAPNGTAKLTGTPAAGTGGVWSFVIVAGNGPAQGRQSFTLTVDEAPAAITSAASATFVVGQPASFGVRTRGFPFLTLSVTGALAPGISFVANPDGTATISGIPQAGSGKVYSLQLNAGGIVQTFVLAVVQPPAILSAAGSAFNVGQSATFTITATSTPVPTITAIGLPSGVTLLDNKNGTAILKGKLSVRGSYAITLMASVPGLMPAMQTFTLTVA
jgi:hypothetical protein